MSEELLIPLSSHFDALRKTVIQILCTILVGFILALLFYQQIFALFLFPLETGQLAILGPLDGLTTTVRLCFWVSFTLTSPLSAFFILRFILPGLYQNEIKRTCLFLGLSLIFLTLGFGFGFFVMIPLANHTLEQFNTTIGTNIWTLENYLNYTVILLMSASILFELALLLLFLVHYHVFTPTTLTSHRRHAVIIAFILGAILTPPDILTQAMVALPLLILYECAIVYAKWRDYPA